MFLNELEEILDVIEPAEFQKVSVYTVHYKVYSLYCTFTPILHNIRTKSWRNSPLQT